ncbi:MAG: inorganic phosphate transporter [Proteobacteria bacterium]|nr:inorganic phosphate transporter [Pseudomonadota bacterium]
MTLVIFLVLLALVFDFINGFHDAANSIATVVSTRVLKPQHAVLWAAFFNFIAAFFFETKVATTIGKGVVDPGAITLTVVVDGVFRKLQLVSAGAYSLAHGLNDAQKTMGIIMLILFSTGYMTAADLGRHAPMWIILSCHGAIALGTMFGGWRIVKTMGMRLTKLAPVGGFAAETSGATTIIGASLLGIPVSTTHTITGAIVGVGATHRLTAVRWGVAGTIVWAWILTIPLSALIAAAVYALLE